MTIPGKTVISAIAGASNEKNGSYAYTTFLLSRPLMVCNTNMLKPSGGVNSAISTSSTMKMPNQTRSKPALVI